jgi:purine-binding chemotaxis protein CheW
MRVCLEKGGCRHRLCHAGHSAETGTKVNMDLAEIRKKAQKETKNGGGAAESPVSVPDRTEQPCDAVTQPVAEAVPDSEGGWWPEEDTAVQVPDQAVSAGRFDPLSVLLAGREASRVEGDDDAAAVAAGGEDLQEFLCFRVSSEIYAINIMTVKEIIRPREVTEIPRAPGFVSGVLSLRGIIIPVFNMRLRLGLAEAEKSGRERIVVITKGEEFIGILVDEVTQVVKITTAIIEKPPAVLDGIDRDFVSGIGRYNGKMLILLNQDKILDISIGEETERGRV